MMKIEIRMLQRFKEDETWMIRSPRRISVTESVNCSVIFHKHLLSAESLPGPLLNTGHMKREDIS